MAGEPTLYARMELRLADAEKKLARFQKNVDGNMGGIERRTKKAAQAMETALSSSFGKIGGMFKSFASGLVAGIAAGGVAGIIDQVRGVARSVAEVGDEARQAGLSLTAFQELKFLAEQNRIGVDALVDGIKELNLRADEFVATGAGSAAEAFGRLGYDAEQLSVKLRDPSALFTEIIGKLQKFDRAAQIRIADELFGGTGGEQFVRLMEQGEAGIRDTIREAHKLGVVMSDELVQRADELDRKFNAITAAVGTGLKSAIVEAAGALQAFISTYKGWTDDYEGRLRIAQAGETIGAMAGKQISSSGDRTTAKTGRLPATIPALPSQADLTTKYLAEYRAELQRTNTERAVAAEAERILSEASSKGLLVTKEQAAALAREKVAREEGEQAAKKLGSEREQSAKRADAERQQIRDLIAELEEELRLVNATDQQRRAAEASRMAGAAATDQERAKIVALNEALYQEEEARRANQDAMLLYRDLTRGAIDDLLAGAEQGKSLWESMGDAAVNSLKRISNVLLDDVLDALFQVNNSASGGGLLGNLVGAVLGRSGGGVDPWGGMRTPSFAGGGYTGSGTRSGGIDGKGGFPAILHPKETIIDHTKGGVGRSQSVEINLNLTVAGEGDKELLSRVDRAAENAVRRGLAGFNRDLPARLNQINRNPSRR